METTESFKDRGNKEFKQRNFQKAIDLYSEGITEERSEQLFGNRAACYMNLNKYEEAVADCRSALAIKPDYPKVVRRLVQGLIAIGNVTEAKSVMEEAYQFNEKYKSELADEIKVIKDLENTESALNKAVDMKNWSSALYFVTEKMRTCKGDKKLILDQLEYMMEAGQTENAGKLSQSMFDDHNSSPRYLYLRGMVLVNDGRLDQAKKFFVQALKNDPDFLQCQKALKKVKKTESMKNNASDFFKSGSYEDAIKGFTECLELFPNNKTYNSSIYLNRAI